MNRSFRAESGQSLQVARQLTPELRGKLKLIQVGPGPQGHTLEQYVDEWVSLGKQLGELEDEKTRLDPSPNQEIVSPGSQLLVARNQWVRVVNAVVANGELAGLDPATDQLLFGPLRGAEKRADRRRRGTQAGPDEPVPAQPVPAQPVPAQPVPAQPGSAHPVVPIA